MNIIDALVISLGIDASAYTKGRKTVDEDLKKLRDSSDKTAKDMAASGKRAAEAFGSIKIELLGLLAVLGAATGLKDFIGSFVTGNASLGRFSDNIGISTQKLDAYRTAAESVGDTLDGVKSSFQAMGSAIAEQRVTGSSAIIQAMQRNGIAPTGDVETNVQLIRNRMQMLERRFPGARGKQMALSLAGQTGLGGMGQTLLDAGSSQASIAALAKASKFTPEAAANAEKLQRQWALLEQHFRAIGQTLADKIEPQLEKLAAWLGAVNWDKVTKNIQSWLDTTGKWIDKLGGVKDILIAIAAIKVLGWMGGIAGAVLRLGVLTKALFGVRTAAMAAATAETAAAAGGGAAGVAATAGKWLSGAGLAAGLGYGAGTLLYDNESDEAQNSQGTAVARFMALFGNKAAQDALDRAAGKTPINHSGDFRVLPQGDAQQAGNAPTASIAAAGQTSHGAAQAMTYFMSQGWTRAQASGIVANIQQESGFNPNIPGDNGEAYGIGQWHADRQKAFAAFIGHDIHGSSLADQLKFYNYELTKGPDKGARHAGDLLRRASSPFAAGALVSLYDERPGDTQGEMWKRGKAAQDIYLGGIQLGAAANAKSSANVDNSSSTSTAQTHIGTIVVNTKATDAKGIAGDMRTALAQNSTVTQANTGLN